MRIKRLGVKSAGFIDGRYTIILTDGTHLMGVQEIEMSAKYPYDPIRIKIVPMDINDEIDE